MNRGQRATRQNNPANNKQFVSGGVISNFTGATKLEQSDSVSPVQAAAAPVISSILKTDPPAIVEAPTAMDIKAELAGDNSQMTEISENGSVNGQKRRFLRQPIPKKIKRLRRNRRLRKILTPKNALMSLHELLGSALSEFTILPEERGFVASVYVNNVQYEGRGPSKMAAKNNASEKALRDIIIHRMLQSPKSHPLKPSGDPALGDDQAGVDDVDMAESENDNDPEGEVPMLHLASFALHKLFSEWQAEGFEIPDFRIGGAISSLENMAVDKAAATHVPGVPPKRTILPENANSMHPTTLLCMMRPATKYVDLGSEGQVPNILHRVGVEVDGNHFIGSAKNKKLGRKNAAIDACNQLFGTTFIKEE